MNVFQYAAHLAKRHFPEARTFGGGATICGDPERWEPVVTHTLNAYAEGNTVIGSVTIIEWADPDDPKDTTGYTVQVTHQHFTDELTV